MRLADSLRPLAPQLALASALSEFEPVLEKEITTRLLDCLGLAPNGDTEPALMSAVYAFLEEIRIGYDRFSSICTVGSAASSERCPARPKSTMPAHAGMTSG